jgi:hypothetical protein
MTTDRALDLALEALEVEQTAVTMFNLVPKPHITKAITAIKQARSAPVQEPDHGNELTIAYMGGVHRGKELAAQRSWAGLTDEEIDKHLSEDAQGDCEMHEFARAIETKLMEKNA